MGRRKRRWSAADGSQLDIETTVRGYRLDLSRVDRGNIEAATAVLRRMRRYGGFELDPSLTLRPQPSRGEAAATSLSSDLIAPDDGEALR